MSTIAMRLPKIPQALSAQSISILSQMTPKQQKDYEGFNNNNTNTSNSSENNGPTRQQMLLQSQILSKLDSKSESIINSYRKEIKNQFAQIPLAAMQNSQSVQSTPLLRPLYTSAAPADALDMSPLLGEPQKNVNTQQHRRHRLLVDSNGNKAKAGGFLNLSLQVQQQQQQSQQDTINSSNRNQSTSNSFQIDSLDQLESPTQLVPMKQRILKRSQLYIAPTSSFANLSTGTSLASNTSLDKSSDFSSSIFSAIPQGSSKDLIRQKLNTDPNSYESFSQKPQPQTSRSILFQSWTDRKADQKLKQALAPQAPIGAAPYSLVSRPEPRLMTPSKSESVLETKSSQSISTNAPILSRLRQHQKSEQQIQSTSSLMASIKSPRTRKNNQSVGLPQISKGILKNSTQQPQQTPYKSSFDLNQALQAQQQQSQQDSTSSSSKKTVTFKTIIATQL